MTVNSVSSSTLSTILQNAVTREHKQLTTLETENSTGLLADIGLTLGASSGQDISLHQQYADLNGFSASNAIVTSQLETSYNAATTLQQSASTMLSQVIEGLSSTPSSTGSAAIQQVAASALQSFVTTANSEVSDVYVFGGINTGIEPINSSAASSTGAAQTAAQSAFSNYLTSIGATAATITGAQMTTFLTSTSLPASQSFTSQFSGTDWSTNWSNASATAQTSRIGLNDTITTSVTTNNTAFQSLAQGLTMLNQFANMNLSSSAYTALMQQAQSVMTAASNDLTDVGATIGTMQSAVKQANSNISLQQDTLNTQINASEAVNPYQAATQLTNLTNQLQVAYSLTAQIQKLSLVNFL
jgi:flagellar hook-associated protein 3 FlgL